MKNILVNKTKYERKEKRKTIIWFLISLVLLSSLIVLVLYMFGFIGNFTSASGEDNGLNLELDPNAREGGLGYRSKEEIEEELNKKVREGMINISMNTSPTFKNGKSSGDLLIINEDINLYPQVVEIYRDDSEELIYRSGVIPVGSKVEEAKLSVNLAKGTYRCTAYFNSVNLEANEFVGKAAAKINISVLN